MHIGTCSLKKCADHSYKILCISLTWFVCVTNAYTLCNQWHFIIALWWWWWQNLQISHVANFFPQLPDGNSLPNKNLYSYQGLYLQNVKCKQITLKLSKTSTDKLPLSELEGCVNNFFYSSLSNIKKNFLLDLLLVYYTCAKFQFAIFKTQPVSSKQIEVDCFLMSLESQERRRFWHKITLYLPFSNTLDFTNIYVEWSICIKKTITTTR